MRPSSSNITNRLFPPSQYERIVSSTSSPSDVSRQFSGLKVHRSDRNVSVDDQGRMVLGNADQRPSLAANYGRKLQGIQHSYIGKTSDNRRLAAQTAEDLEAQNDDLINELHLKVKGLREVATGMRDQVNESSSLLDKMSSAMTTASGLLGTTMSRLQSLASFRTGRHIWYMMLFFVCVLFLLYLLFGKSR